MANPINIALSNQLQTIVKEARMQLVSQGHKDSGELINSVGARVKELSDGLLGEISFLEYGLAQDTGIKANKIPYKEGSGAGRSKYIDALTAWVKRKGIEGDSKKAKGIAFAIAKTHKKVGMHSKGGRFAPEKQGWFSGTINKLEPSIESAIGLALGNNIGALMDTLVDESNRNIGNVS